MRDRVLPLLMLFYLAALSIALSFIFPLNDLRLSLHPQAGPRYFLFACVFILLAVLHLAFTAGSPAADRACLLLAMAVAVGIPADFFHPRQPDARWADNAAVFRSLPAGSDFFVPVVPLYHGGMLLHKTSPRRGPSPLARLRPSPRKRRPTSPSPGRRKSALIRGDQRPFLDVAGWAIDGAARAPAGGVFVDDRRHAVPGGVRAAGADRRRRALVPGLRLFPPDPDRRDRPRPHQVSLVVVTRDGSGSYQPAAPRTFTTISSSPSSPP